MPRLRTLFGSLFRFLVLALGATVASASAATPPVDYGRDVRPILSDKCHTNVI